MQVLPRRCIRYICSVYSCPLPTATDSFKTLLFFHLNFLTNLAFAPTPHSLFFLACYHSVYTIRKNSIKKTLHFPTANHSLHSELLHHCTNYPDIFQLSSSFTPYIFVAFPSLCKLNETGNLPCTPSGREFMEAFGLIPRKSGYAPGYREDIDPSINNVFATAAFRYGHTLISGTLQ